MDMFRVCAPNWGDICIFIYKVRFHALRGLTWALSPQYRQTSSRAKQWELSWTSPPTSSSSSLSCVQKKFPSENSGAIPTTAASSSPRLSARGARVPVTVFPHLHFARLYIPSLSLFPHRLYVARQRRKKSTSLVQIFLFIYTRHVKISTTRIIRAVCMRSFRW